MSALNRYVVRPLANDIDAWINERYPESVAGFLREIKGIATDTPNPE